MIENPTHSFEWVKRESPRAGGLSLRSHRTKYIITPKPTSLGEDGTEVMIDNYHDSLWVGLKILRVGYLTTSQMVMDDLHPVKKKE